MCVVVQYLFTEGPEVDGEREGVATSLLVTLAPGKVKVKPQQRHCQEGRELPQLGRLQREREKGRERERRRGRERGSKGERVLESVPILE